MPAYSHEFYRRVFNSICPVEQEDKIHIHKRACNILFII